MSSHHGFAAFLDYPFAKALFDRRTHRVHQGVSRIAAGSMTYQSTQPTAPLAEEEEAILIASTGCTGITMPDRPFEELDAAGRKVRDVPAKPSLTLFGRAAGSPDNAQAAHFIMINDSGTYFLRNLPPDPAAGFTLENLVARARLAKVQLLPGRLDVDSEEKRLFPAYLDANRFLSNRPGTTLFLPLVDMSAQYINGLMYILTQPPGTRPTFVDDRNFYAVAGVKRWVKSKFLNPDLKVPLGVIGGLRTQIEADLLLQNLALTAEALGLGGWIHSTITPPLMCGDPRYRAAYGPMLGLTYQTPRWRLLDVLRWSVLLPRYRELRTHPIALKQGNDFLIRAKCPENYDGSMAKAVDAVLATKQQIYSDRALFERTFKDGYGPVFMKEAQGYEAEVVDCVRAVCEYIHRKHGRFPAHIDAIHVPGVWLQVHHPDCAYYDQYFQNGLTAAQRAHAAAWRH